MVFALGFLAATLLALLMLPAMNRRAERLARRRVEAIFPLSIAELTAQKDHLRAEFAVTARRLEREAETARSARRADREEIGRQIIALRKLEDEIAERDRRIGLLEASGAETGAAFTGVQSTLAEANAALSESKAALAAREAAHAALEAAHRDALGELDMKRIALAELETRLQNLDASLSELQQTLAAREEDLRLARERAAEQERLLASEHTRANVLEDRVASLDGLGREQAQRIEHLEAAEVEFAGRLTEAAAKASRREMVIAERDVALAAAQAKLADAERRLAEAADSARDDAVALERTVATLRAENLSLQGALESARGDRSRLQREVAGLQRGGAPVDPREQSETAELRQRIEDVAAEIVRLTEARKAPAANGRRPA